MAVQRFDLLVHDPVPVFSWIAAHCSSAVVRKIAYHTVAGWHMKITLGNEDASAAFRRRWSGDFSSPGKRLIPRPPEEVFAELSEN